MTTVTYINAMGGHKSKYCDMIARDIWLWTVAKKNWLSAAYTPGQQNTVADGLSQQFNTALERKLHPSLFESIVTHFGKPDIDLFASRINDQVDIYASWKPDLNASYVDALSINWERFANSYYFPSFCLIARCLQKVVLEQATMIIVVPM